MYKLLYSLGVHVKVLVNEFRVNDDQRVMIVLPAAQSTKKCRIGK
jgi:hypothetical protein